MSVSLSPRRSKPIPFSWAGQNGIIDNDLKLINSPSEGQCPGQPPYFNTSSSSNSDSDAAVSTAEQQQLRPRRIREDDNVGTPPSLAGFYMFNITRDRCENPFVSRFYGETINLPRQARDTHKETLKKRGVFSAGMSCTTSSSRCRLSSTV